MSHNKATEGLLSNSDAPWFPIDNAANLYTGARKKHWCRTFRIALLLDREITPALLQQALDDTAKRFPTLFAKLKDGVFWSYFERTDERAKIEPETDYPYRPIKIEGTRQPCFRVLYYRNRISLEIFHGITDGGGAIRFLCTLVGRYLELSGEVIPKTGFVFDINAPVTTAEMTDSYHEYYDAACSNKSPATENVLLNENNPTPGFAQLIHGICQVEDLKTAAKKYSLSITEYLVAGLIYMYIGTSAIPIDKNININVPVDLRKRFPSVSVRNFAYMVDVSFNPHGRTEVEFNEIADAIRGVLKEKTDKERLLANISANVASQDSKLSRPVPTPIKRLFLKAAYRNSQRTYTTFISNYGELDCPPEMSRHILRAELLLGDTPYIHFGCAAISINGLFNLTFSSGNSDIEKQRFFFRFLASDGVKLRIESNVLNRKSGDCNEM